MTKKTVSPRGTGSPYRVWVKPAVHGARKRLPGRTRQQVKRIIDDLSQEPRPSASRALTLPATMSKDWEVRRIRLEDWRVVYAVSDVWREVSVLTIQKRPPYDYEDLDALLAEL